MQLGAKRRKGILERGRIHHVFELECEEMRMPTSRVEEAIPSAHSRMNSRC